MITFNFPIWRIFLFIIGTALSINALILFFTSNFNLGNVLTLLLGIFLILYSVYFEWINANFPIWLKTIIALGLSAVVLLSGFLLIYGLNDNSNNKEDALIVLGAAVHGKTPSATLSDRLDAAADYHKQNPDALIIVSGGKGPQEEISEAEAMKKYLIEKGVNSDKIIKEEKSTSTLENFKFSKEILDNTFGKDYSVAFVTNEYHIYRANNIAKEAGIKNINHTHCNTRWYTLASGTLRECIGVLKYWIID